MVVFNLLKINVKGFFIGSLFFIGSFFCFSEEDPAAEAGYWVVDSFGRHNFNQPPKNILVMDWTLMEQLIALGVTPVGVPNINEYERYRAIDKELLTGISDIGKPWKPDLKAIAKLKPDVIILGTDQKEFTRVLIRFAKIMYFQNFSHRFENNGEKVFTRLDQLATLTQKQAQAEKIKKIFKQKVNELNVQLKQKLGVNNKVILLRFISKDKAIVYSSHSNTGYVAKLLGLNNAVNFDKNKFGEKTFSLKEINKIDTDYFLCFDGCGSIEDKKNVLKVDNAWPYGGYPSLMKMIDGISNAILQKKSKAL